jgi:hypothetical protein
MRLLERGGNGKITLTEFPNNRNRTPRYAILSHTWSDDEVTFQDIKNGVGHENPVYEQKAGYQKIAFCADRALRDGLQYFWVDSCCIDKSSSAELQESLNRMFRWYRCASKCYVYLSDVSATIQTGEAHSAEASWSPAFRTSRWFRRGWTLQELIAPACVEFFSREAILLGNKSSLEQAIHEITKIPIDALRGSSMSDFTVSERLAWKDKRDTTIEEDKAYSLFGILDVQIPLLYGEGEAKAFKRIYDELNKAAESGQTPRSLISAN